MADVTIGIACACGKSVKMRMPLDKWSCNVQKDLQLRLWQHVQAGCESMKWLEIREAHPWCSDESYESLEIEHFDTADLSSRDDDDGLTLVPARKRGRIEIFSPSTARSSGGRTSASLPGGNILMTTLKKVLQIEKQVKALKGSLEDAIASTAVDDE